MNQFLPIEEYRKIAIKLIGIYRKKVKFIPLNEDLIGECVHYMLVADWNYDETKKIDRKKWRRIRGIYGIRDYIRRNQDFLEIQDYIGYTSTPDYNIKVGRKVDFILKNSGLSQKQLNVLTKYLEGKNSSTIASESGISSEQCRKIYRNSINKIRKLFNVE